MVGNPAPTWLIVPCFNEAHRWSREYWNTVSRISDMRLLMVDDGSSDSTGHLLRNLAETAPGVEVLSLASNGGKGNAVREGLVAAIDRGATSVGFIDADGAFDTHEIPQIFAAFRRVREEPDPYDALWTSRVALAGRSINRRAQRHYIGRVVATIVSSGLPGVPYDTQCGFKIFAVSPTLRHVLDTPFRTRWLFDVEILQRWWENTGYPMRVWEEPLLSWSDVPGSAIRAAHATTVAREVAMIARENRRIAAQRHRSVLH
jgi:dolichyl-phosphate beta-glucosyltransferase